MVGTPTRASAGRPRGGAHGFLGALYEAKADPGVEEYDPRPEWYFFFLFELLRIFKAPELLIFATMIIPTLWMILLIAWPFLDRRPERRVSQRPIAMAIGASVPVVLLALTWYGSKAPGAAGETSAQPGAAAFIANGCATCHTMADAGANGSIGPNLDTAQPDYETAKAIITNGAGVMPSFASAGLNETRSTAWPATWPRGPAAPARRRARRAQRRPGYPAACEAAARITSAPPGRRPRGSAGGGCLARPTATPIMRVFLGITGASGAPYAARVLDGLAAAGAEIGVCASASAGEVIAWEVYRDRALDPQVAIERLVDEHGGARATLYGERDWFSPYASGSARCDAYVICPCSMATCGTIASPARRT